MTTATASASGKWRNSSRTSPSASASTEPVLGNDVEFIDVGCGNGRSTQTVRKKLKIEGRGVGIDRSAARLPASTTPNIAYVETDLLSLSNKKQCQFVTMLNVLPGLQSYAAAYALFRKAAIISRDFVYVSQPNFDANAYLLRLGFKTYYSDAGANRFQATAADYYRMARDLLDEGLIQDFSIVESGRIRDSSDDVIHPLQTPPESGAYNPAIHRYKAEDIVFPEPIYRRIQVIMTRKPAQLVPISKRLRDLEEQDNIVASSLLT